MTKSQAIKKGYLYKGVAYDFIPVYYTYNNIRGKNLFWHLTLILIDTFFKDEFGIEKTEKLK